MFGIIYTETHALKYLLIIDHVNFRLIYAFNNLQFKNTLFSIVVYTNWYIHSLSNVIC